MSGQATLRDVAAAAGVHPGTASRALRPATRHQVAGQSADRILRAARDLGYVRDQAAASLRTRRSGMAGLLAADLGDPLTAPLLRGAEDALRPAGYVILAASAAGGAEEALRAMRARRADGVIIAGCQPRLAAAAARAGLPSVPAGCAAGAAPGDCPCGPPAGTAAAAPSRYAAGAAAGRALLARVLGPGAAAAAPGPHQEGGGRRPGFRAVSAGDEPLFAAPPADQFGSGDAGAWYGLIWDAREGGAILCQDGGGRREVARIPTDRGLRESWRRLCGDSPPPPQRAGQPR